MSESAQLEIIRAGDYYQLRLKHYRLVLGYHQEAANKSATMDALLLALGEAETLEDHKKVLEALLLFLRDDT